MVSILKVTTLGQVTLYILNKVWAHVLEVSLKIFDDFLQDKKMRVTSQEKIH